MKKLVMRRPLLLVVLSFLSCVCFAQVKTKVFFDSIPASMIPHGKKAIREKNFNPPPDFQLKSDQKQTSSSEYINRFATSLTVDVDFLKEANVTTAGDVLIFSLKLKAQRSLNVSLGFDRFYLTDNSILSIHTRKELTDSILSDQNNVDSLWSTRVYQGNELTVILKVPSNEKDLVKLHINRISFGYKPFGGEYYGNPGASAPCNINVACPEANGWQNERNSIVMIVSGGVESCSGAMVMNTCNLNIPYMLTANHCLLSGNLQAWVMQFQTWSAVCSGNSGWVENVQYTGCQLRANHAPSDFALVELNQVPQPASGITYSGWDNAGGFPIGAVSLHHPAGDLMKFSRDYQILGQTSWGGTNNHWGTYYDEGTAQPGSSGSPLYNMNHRVVGQCHGNQMNPSDYCASRFAEYGKFSHSWSGGGTNATRLSNWLDPGGTLNTTTNTTAVSGLIRLPSFSISGNNSLCSGSSGYSISAGLPAGTTYNWTVTPGGIATLSCTTCAAPTLTKTGNGKVTLTAVITRCGHSATLTKSVVVGIPAYNDLVIYSEGPYVCANVPVDFGAFYQNTTACSINKTGATNIEWSVSPSPLQIINNSGMGVCPGVNNSGVEIKFGTPGSMYNVRFRTQNACGYSSYSNPYVVQVAPGSCGGFAFTVSPNPASDVIELSVSEGAALKTGAGISEVRISDQRGIVLKHVKNNVRKSKMSLDISSLTPGLYIIQASDGKTWKSKTISVK